MSDHDNDTCPHLVLASLLEAENARLKAEVERLTNLQSGADYFKAEVERLNLLTVEMDKTINISQAGCRQLKAEVERLKNTDPNSISGSTIMSDPAWSIACFRFHRENERAEIARLRKAGDELERVLTSRSGSYEAGNASHEWQSAKNYKPSV